MAYEDDADRLRIWEATYAAAFVAEFNRARDVIDGLGRRIPFDRALADNAEAACTVADAAVARLDDWIKNGRA